MKYAITFLTAFVFISFQLWSVNESVSATDSNFTIPADSNGEGIVSDTMQKDTITPGELNSSAPSAINQLDEKMMESNKNNPGIKGYTILLYSNSGANSKLSARYIQLEFQEMYPDIPTHLAWKSPNYEVRVGDFRTKIEAEKVLHMIQEDFPRAFIKSDYVALPPLGEEESETPVKQ